MRIIKGCKLILLMLIGFSSYAQPGSRIVYSSKFIKAPGFIADSSFTPPSDTTNYKSGFAVKNGVAYIGNGVSWSAVGGGSSSPTGEYNKQDTGTVTTNGTSPTGTTNHRYSFEYGQNGRAVHLHYVANWPNTGSGISTFTIPLPADCPTPQLPNGISGANANISVGSGILQTALTAETTARVVLKVNNANTGYEIECVASSGSYRIANVSLTYFTTAP